MIDLFAPGAYGRRAGGNLERPDDQKQTIEWMAWSLNPDNGGGGGIAVWSECRDLWDAAGIENFPWMHVHTFENLDRLISVAEANDSPAIGLNIEDVAKDFPGQLPELGRIVRERWVERYGKPVHMPTLAWVDNGQGWEHVSYAVAALEIMPDESPWFWPGGKYDSTIARQCIEHAFSEGLTKVTFMFKTKNHTRSEYEPEFAICHSLYTADDIEPSASGWAAWSAPEPCARPQPPEVPSVPIKPLTAKQFPFTGPLYGPNGPKPQTMNRSTVKGLKRAMIRLRYLDAPLGKETDDYGPEFEEAMRVYQAEIGLRPASGQYGRNTWLALREEKLTAGSNAGQYAMDARALKYVREDSLKRVYPHPQGSLSEICQGLHPTAGITGNWAIDFCAPGGTKVLAVEDATIRKLSGHDPSDGAEQTIGIFGWSIHYETPDGYRYFSTHYGSRAGLSVGQIVNAGQVVGTVGHWPGDPARSHTHLGVTSPISQADAKKRITEISQAPRVVA